MSLDWMTFFDSHHVEYITSGPNVARDHIAVHCPFCGPADPSHHMSVSLKGKGWRCWRRPEEHSGKSPARLVSALLRIPYEQARRMVGGNVFIPDGDILAAVRDRITPPEIVRRTRLEEPQEFKRFSRLPSARPFVDYLRHDRGFLRREIARFSDDFDMRYATQGSFRNRIIFLVRLHGQLVSWTGRAIYPVMELRYRALSDDPDVADTPALGPLPDYLLWYDKLMTADADTICICEGPFDALKTWVLGEHEGIVATCLFTATSSDSQLELLHELLPRFKRRFLLLDRGTFSTGLKLHSALSSLDVWVKEPPGKDPGDLETTTELLRALFS